MPTILLVRHAQASFGTDDYDALSRRGFEQVDMLARDLARRGVRIDRVLSGTLVRQRDTAAPLANAAGVPVIIDPRWDEFSADEILRHHSDTPVRLEHRPSEAPELTPRQFQDILDAAVLCWINRAARARTSETWPAFSARVTAALDDLAGGLARGETAVACTSGGPVAATCVRLLALPGEAFPQFNRVAANTGVTKIVHGRSGTTLVSFNEHGHLEGRNGSLITYR